MTSTTEPSSRFDAFWPGELERIILGLKLLKEDRVKRHMAHTDVVDLLADAEAAFDRSCLAEAKAQ